MLVVNLVNDSETLGQAVTSLGNAGTMLVNYARTTPEAFTTKGAPASRDLRREAYLQFQAAVWRSFSQSNLLVHAAEVTNRGFLQGRPRDPFGRILTVAEDSHETLVALMEAVSRLRMVGSPEPRTRAEEIVAMTGKLFENLPIIGMKTAKAATLARFTEWQKRIGEAQKQFTEVCRVDLGYAKLPRTHWWQLRRPRTAEAWPGGWPGPKLELTDPTGEAVGPPEAPAEA